MPPAVYLDECIDRPVLEAMRQRGFDVLTALEAGRGEDPDEAQLVYASEHGRVFFTYNRMDFRRLHAKFARAGRPHAGIVVMPQASPLRRRQLRAVMLLDWLGSLNGGCASRLFQWNDLQRVLVSGLRLPGYTEADTMDVLGRGDPLTSV